MSRPNLRAIEGMSDVYRRNKTGLRKEPCITPYIVSYFSLIYCQLQCISLFIVWTFAVNKLNKMLYFVPNVIMSPYLISSILIQTLLNVGISTLDGELIKRVAMSSELLFIRDGSFVLAGNLQEELTALVNYLCRCD